MESIATRSSETARDVELNEHEQVPQSADREFESKPWKYVGYKGYVDFLSSDDDLFILRRFNALNTRIALVKQDKISELEQRLAEIDEQHRQRDAPDVNNGTIRDDLEERRLLLNDISDEIYRYNKIVLQQSRLREYPAASTSDIKNIEKWHFNRKGKEDYGAIDADEQKYLNHKNDLICVTHKNKTPLRKMIDKSRRLRTLGVWRSKDEKSIPHDESQDVSYYSDQRIDGFASAFIVFVGLTMLVAPIWVLDSLESMRLRLMVITVFIVVFLLVMSFAMVAKPFEALGATAA
ncbi:hypothetical protein PFICI_10104 [Pestalotiopsis fici W106-1]|uniref:DUF6594 domain-containing protein n=1 Tax=Pestalotiopsis fici (strain W106-1 / CGMCC3.15140) TaxID=1229662 RepID=W3WY12_PESFW|nr:uncharacterized protein PFICI_10104 [Pestalotiopsis fici W106-1]ETS78042.1 hypothetical protein PFICI_10104 [Pestalotiopsis fici W106-1]